MLVILSLIHPGPASGQYDEAREKDVLKLLGEGKAPDSPDDFWNGELRYGKCASLVQFIDHKYGRARLRSLLCLSKGSEILQSLQTTESSLLTEWSKTLRTEDL